MLIEFGNFGSNIIVEFQSNDSLQKYHLSKLQFTLNVSELFEDAIENQIIILTLEGPHFEVFTKRSYSCEKTQSFNLTSTYLDYARLTVSNLQAQAFHDSYVMEFRYPMICDRSDSAIGEFENYEFMR
jgi:hypothetical protein